jgi:hypothetical protein
MPLELLDKKHPRDQPFHSFEESFATGLAFLVLVFGLGEADLVHENHRFINDAGIISKIGSYSEVP